MAKFKSWNQMQSAVNRWKKQQSRIQKDVKHKLIWKKYLITWARAIINIFFLKSLEMNSSRKNSRTIYKIQSLN